VNIPNLITLARFGAVPVTVWLILNGALATAFWVFLAAGLSDALDGLVAKRFNAETELGKFLDPLADKALLVSVYVALGHQGHLDSWLVILVVFRDVIIVGGAILYQTLTQALKMQPLMISKINTAAQIVLAGLILGGEGFALDVPLFIGLMVYLVAATTVLSGGFYVVTWTQRAVIMEDRD